MQYLLPEAVLMSQIWSLSLSLDIDLYRSLALSRETFKAQTSLPSAEEIVPDYAGNFTLS